MIWASFEWGSIVDEGGVFLLLLLFHGNLNLIIILSVPTIDVMIISYVPKYQEVDHLLGPLRGHSSVSSKIRRAATSTPPIDSFPSANRDVGASDTHVDGFEGASDTKDEVASVPYGDTEVHAIEDRPMLRVQSNEIVETNGEWVKCMFQDGV